MATNQSPEEEKINNIAFFNKVLLPTDAQENCFKRSIKIYIKTV